MRWNTGGPLAAAAGEVTAVTAVGVLEAGVVAGAVDGTRLSAASSSERALVGGGTPQSYPTSVPLPLELPLFDSAVSRASVSRASAVIASVVIAAFAVSVASSVSTAANTSAVFGTSAVSAVSVASAASAPVADFATFAAVATSCATTGRERVDAPVIAATNGLDTAKYGVARSGCTRDVDDIEGGTVWSLILIVVFAHPSLPHGRSVRAPSRWMHTESVSLPACTTEKWTDRVGFERSSRMTTESPTVSEDDMSSCSGSESTLYCVATFPPSN